MKRNAWEVWTSVFTNDECDAIIERGLRYVPQEAFVGFDGSNRRDSSYRSSVIRWLNLLSDRDIVDRLMQFVHQSNRTNFGYDIVAPYEVQFTEYFGHTEGKYDWHHDLWLEGARAFDRKLSVVLQLSRPDEYVGGRFEFFGVQNPDECFMPRGSVLIFPSFLEHRVLPVSSGLRRSLVTWVEGPRWR